MSRAELSSRAEVLHKSLEEAMTLCQSLLDDDSLAEALDGVVEAIVSSLRDGGKVLLCGNGGSAADAQHLAAELVGRFCLERQPFPAIALADNIAAVTAVSNDYAYEDVFARAVNALGNPGDVLIGLSTSGSSANVIEALTAARERDLVTVAFVGRPGSPIEQLSEHVLSVTAPSTARIQEAHMLLGHTLFELVERELCQG
jgi:D-sedoheptulose 7-phosphate isomerase